MRSRTLGRTGVSVSEIGFGAWAIGGGWGEQKEEDSIAALHRALDLGCTFIDTAAGYGDGHSVGLSTPEHDQNSVIDLMRGGWLDAVQVIYNVFDQEPAAELLPVAQETNVGVIVRVVLDEGVLAGRYTKDTTFGEGDFRRSCFAGDRLERAVARTEGLRREIEGSGLTLPQAAIQFACPPAVSTVIPGIRSVAQAEANCGVSDLAPMPEALVLRLRQHAWRRAFWYGGK